MQDLQHLIKQQNVKFLKMQGKDYVGPWSSRLYHKNLILNIFWVFVLSIVWITFL